jgi:ribonuclease Z
LVILREINLFQAMSDFKIHILGCGSATPSFRHLPACQAVEYRGRVMLIDCGEGAQLSVRRQRLKFSRITDVFISHMHGDHFLGLPGLLSTLSLHEVGGRVRVHVFEEGAKLLDQIMRVVCHETTFKIEYNIITPEGGVVLDDDAMTVTAFPLYHGVPCVGFRFDEKPKMRHLRGDMVRFFNVPIRDLAGIKVGNDFVTPDGRVIENARLTTDADPAMSYAYCSDTMFDTRVADAVRGVHTLYHEATYAGDMEAQARRRAHSTARQAAEIARMAGVQRLVLGHYSKRYDDMELHLREAREVFDNTVAGDEGMTIAL